MKLQLIIAALFTFGCAAAPQAVRRDDASDVGFTHVFEEAGQPEGLEKRGYGCDAIGGDDVGICNFHCVNKVTFKCGNGKVLRPYKGVCGGFLTATCQCVYNTKC
ncbi:hypothetical protein B0J12DRAFT_743332 [Macrophomina phaseolina]|uniref:Uncharacterized protein n=1 Tax=Macrophomina phaseolina TaxID=35725 RepID=A0ABQ8G1V5_9PEZI|nr:hypothetical protein B0J12DRAFT_743332 [Macrophomina phaseolina]